MSSDAVDLPARLPHIAALDGLRGIAVLLVLGVHGAGSHFPGGSRGVDLFFVLSGFLITGLLIGEHQATGAISFGHFYARRALRLLPALLVVLAFVAVSVRALAGVGTVAQLVNIRDIVGPLLYVHNFVKIAYFDEGGMMTHAWTLAVEEQFYLIWPIVMLLLLRRGSSCRKAAVWLLATAGVAVLVMAVRVSTGTSTNVLYASTESHGAVMLLTGSAIAFWHHQVDPDQSTVIRLAGLSWPVAAAALAGMVFLLPHNPGGYYLGGWAVVALVSAILLIAALRPSSQLTRTLSWRPLRWFGEISYGLYLWHLPLWTLTWHILTPAGYGSAVVTLVAMPIALLIAVISYYGMERPIMRAGRARLGRHRAQQLAATSGAPS